ncbi:MAG: subclass B1 metallo-beta-lactamase [Bacteroidetes bacterium]|nr:subclass B1 metallo-beta-lactamase [Bacteroidota bacterium]
MKMNRLIKFLILVLLFGSTSRNINAQDYNDIVIDNDIQLIHLKDSVYIHETWHYLRNFGRFPSNGLIVIKNGQALMIDTPMDNDKTERLTKYIQDSMSVDLKKLIIGHFHDDCMGGLEYLQGIGVESVANSMTIEKCIELELPIPSKSFTDSLTFDFNGKQIECRYLGAGHSFDNIIVWIASEKILFGGCLIKSIQSKGLGNLTDAVVNDWDTTIEKVMQKYPGIGIVVPGHGHYGNTELLTHTIKLIEKENCK